MDMQPAWDLLKAGANVSVDAKDIIADLLIAMARDARRSGARLTITNSDHIRAVRHLA
jgi:shikimate 5-dehydrogenase